MKSVLLGLLVTVIVLPLGFLMVITITGLSLDDPSMVLVVVLPLALFALIVTGLIQKWGRIRLLLSILIGPLLLLMIRLTFFLVDNGLDPMTNPSRLPLAIALNCVGITLSFLVVSCLYVWLLKKLSR
ncbi:MAG: hypothetical protein A3F47_01085 [Candidatus Staskawiczbacteria bacterium RIFCSPHIGHO2_12_FULL_38_11]|uniref:Uncharacterized protein n=1 Tax=Candidatus Staskawiczbacteria bacterium RIFCSPHIGHO2_12_FULL_38_11 TaxID=1802209 RepID=A0A1G2I764_9BACT|nr:MAG: hypothetical protein A3F47_01085 [Candidatus Staskawiczbacteria bacterium RIFCSPHIGHO2_12_FULL_38_11]